MNLALFSNFYTHSLPGLPVLMTIFDLIFVPLALLYLIKSSARVGIPTNRNSEQIFVIYFLILILFVTLIPYIYFESKLGIKNLEDCINLVYALVIFIMFASFFNADETRVHKAIKFWYFGAILAGIFSVITILGLAPSHWRLGVRISGSFKTVNQLQSFVGPALIFGIYFFLESKKYFFKVLHFLCLMLIILALLATGSRSSILNILIAIIFINHISLIRFPQVKRTFILLFVVEVVALSAITLFVVSFLNGTQIHFYDFDLTNIIRIINKLQEIATSGDLGPRGEQWAYVIYNFFYYPFGIGHGNFQAVVGIKNEVHNTFLGVLIENGWVALVALTILYIVLPLSCLRRLRVDKKLSLLFIYLHIEMILYQLTNYGLRQRIFWIEFALVLSYIYHLRIKNNAKIV